MVSKFEIYSLPIGSLLCHHAASRGIKPSPEEENIELYPLCEKCYENSRNGCGKFISSPTVYFNGFCGQYWKSIFGDCYKFITPIIIYDMHTNTIPEKKH